MMGQERHWFGRTWRPAAIVVAAAWLNGCGLSQMTSSIGDGGLFSSGKKADTAAWTPIITEESMLTAARTNSDGPLEMAAAAGCPRLEVEAGGRYVTSFEGNHVGDAAAVINRGEIVKTARECRAGDGEVAVKYGIAGRVLLGPKGKAGTITFPMTMLIEDKAKAKVKSEPFVVTVTITQQNPLAYFSTVREVSIPVKQGTLPQDYRIVLSFEKTKPGTS
jgi:hypothetical protein